MTERSRIRAIVLGMLIAVIVGIVAEDPVREFIISWQNHPRFLTRGIAAMVIQRSAQFRHKTKLFFTVSEAEGLFPGVCHNFEFSPEKMQVLSEYLKTGAMKFSPYGNQMPPFPEASLDRLIFRQTADSSWIASIHAKLAPRARQPGLTN